MVAAPEYGTMTFMGRSGISYAKDFYFSDVVAASLRFDEGGGASATSETFVTFGEPVLLVDIAIHTGGTDSKMFQVTRNGITTGDVIRHTIHLDTLANRPGLRIPFAAGVRISGIQRA